MYYINEHEFGLAGLGLLRNWLVGDEIIIKSILEEIRLLNVASKNRLFCKKEIRKYDVYEGYQAWAATYDRFPNLLIKVEEPVVKSLLRKFSPGLALDAGCGTGRYSKFLHSLGYTVTGVDFSQAMLHRARLKNNKINYMQADLTSLLFENGSMDLIVCALTLTHFLSIKQVISEFSRVVRSGGHIVLSDIHPWIVALGGQAEFKDKIMKNGYITNYIHWHSTYLRAFDLNGLKVLKCIEPTIKSKHLKCARLSFRLSDNTISAALEGLPLALVWVLERL